MAYQASGLTSTFRRPPMFSGGSRLGPVLRPSDLALEKKVVLEEINTVDDTPDDLVFELHNAQMWGNHPWYSILGTRETVGGLDQTDSGSTASVSSRADIVVAAAGNVEHDALIETLEASGWAEDILGGLPALKSPAPIVQTPGAVHFERDTAQTHIVFGSATFAHEDPRRHALSLVGMLLVGDELTAASADQGRLDSPIRSTPSSPSTEIREITASTRHGAGYRGRGR